MVSWKAISNLPVQHCSGSSCSPQEHWADLWCWWRRCSSSGSSVAANPLTRPLATDPIPCSLVRIDELGFKIRTHCCLQSTRYPSHESTNYVLKSGYITALQSTRYPSRKDWHIHMKQVTWATNILGHFSVDEVWKPGKYYKIDTLGHKPTYIQNFLLQNKVPNNRYL